ncbi:MAG TPA: GntR family transcriptional regulator [Thermoclostridium sp.]|nr:GntR family transcriptional regulator [Clostridiaceae bacterium]HOQ75355.1 GntR family transcriptional regulator [Thermoclostridium sp.]HPU45840.1 GntR family transcriptional regulator [Thermoclostridium sp.]
MISERTLLPKHASLNIGDGVYYSLRKNIITLNLKPGEPLNIKTISEKLNVSRTPVRDALIKLAKEGLVDVIPQKGTSVSKIDLKRVEEERFLRESLELRAIEMFIGIQKESDISRLRSIIDIQKECAAKNDLIALQEYDDEFHKVFFTATEKETCWEIIQSMSGHYRRIRLISLWERPIIDKVIDQHEKILDCIVRSKVEESIAAFKDHSSRIIVEEKELTGKYPEYFKLQSDDDFLMQDFLSML